MELGRRLCERGIDVISGMALGIDGYAHKGAIAAIESANSSNLHNPCNNNCNHSNPCDTNTIAGRSAGYTYAVLGCGVDVCYPRQNSDIYYKLSGGSLASPVKQELSYGALISEFPPGTKPLAGQFPMRNRIISGLADAVIVVEAREKSGSLITADLALEQGREVYVIPGRITDPLSRGCNKLAEIGAHLITNLDDFVNSICPFSKSTPEREDFHIDGLATNEKLLYSCLDFESRFLGNIVDLSGLSYQETVAGLMALVQKGLIIEGPKNYYSLRLR